MAGSISSSVSGFVANNVSAIDYVRVDPVADESVSAPRHRLFWLAVAATGWLGVAGWYATVLAGVPSYRYLPLVIAGLILTQIGPTLFDNESPPPPNGYEEETKQAGALPRPPQRRRTLRRHMRKVRVGLATR